MRKTMIALFIAAISVSLFTSLHAQEVYTDNVVIVFDDSGSMSEAMRDAKGNSVRKIEAAKIALHEVLKQVPDTTHVGLVTFHKKWLYPLGPKDDNRLKGAIDSLSAGGGTPLGEFEKIGADALLAKRAKQYGYGSYRLLVVTDGEAGDEYLVERYTPEIVARGITLDVIGVAMASRHTLSRYAHSYRAANDPASLTAAIKEVFAEVSEKGTQGDVGEEAFEVIAPIPDEVAMAIISSFTRTGNHPIGTKPKPQAVQTTQTTSQQTAQQTTQPSQQPAPSVQRRSKAPWILGGIVVVVIIILAIAVISSGSDY